MQITRKVMPYIIAGAGILGAAGIYTNKQAEIRQQEKCEAEFWHKVDSVQKADGLTRDAALCIASSNEMTRTGKEWTECLEAMMNTCSEQMYDEACKKYNLDPKLPQTKGRIEEIKALEAKIDSIRQEGGYYPKEENGLYSKIKDIEFPRIKLPTRQNVIDKIHEIQEMKRNY